MEKERQRRERRGQSELPQAGALSDFFLTGYLNQMLIMWHLPWTWQQGFHCFKIKMVCGLIKYQKLGSQQNASWLNTIGLSTRSPLISKEPNWWRYSSSLCPGILHWISSSDVVSITSWSTWCCVKWAILRFLCVLQQLSVGCRSHISCEELHQCDHPTTILTHQGNLQGRSQLF